MFSAQASLTMRLRWLRLLPISLLFTIAVAQTPNNPTRILRRDNLLYVFEPSSSTSSQFQLGTIDVSSPIDSARLPYTTLYPTLPFLDDTTPRAFTPLLDDSGNITVYTGDCSQGANGGHVWTFTPSSAKEKGIGSWKQEDVSVKDSTHNAVMGPNYLGGGMTFSSTVDGDAASTSAYIFGGMCPFSDANSTTWQSAANYSNLMTTLQPSGTRDNTIAYTLDLSTSRGPPVPEAGFSITGLEPTFSNRSDGSQTQQQNFLLIGGHTSTAFINMSQVALFSLPEQGWTFIGVEETDSSHTDLARRANAATIDPRSGHTAALTPDGQRIVVFGGWVGDTGTPAEPQLAILNIASGYGGKDDWHWTLPSSLGEGLPTDSGLYGHGATMLPGGVMMIRGGYTIPSPSSRRRATPTVNSKSYFFNVTSNTWVTDYSPPPEAPDDDPINTGPLSSPGQKVGLGVGLGMGLAAVCGLFAFYMWYTRRLRKQREVREKQIQNLSFTTRRYNLDDYSPNFDGRGGQSDAMDYLAGQNGNYYFPPGTQGGQGWKQTASQDAERTGLLVEIPSPTRGLRRSLSGRPGLVTGKMRGPGNIHPIDELEEDPDEEHTHDSTATEKRAEMSERGHIRRKSILDGAPVLDPFIDARSEDEDDSGRHSPVDPRTQSFTSVRSNVQEDIDSFRTAQSSFAHLQAEGEALLGDHPISPIEPSTTDNRKSFPAAASPPRRAASDASFWRSRRGQQDWLEDELDTRWKRTAGDDWGTPEDIALAERDRQRREWRERGNLLVTDNDPLPTPRTPIRSDQLGVPPSDERPCTPASEADWDVEAAVERRVVQVMFTVPKSKLRVVNADVDHFTKNEPEAVA
ncbi:hypothetical protein SNOG_04802 [Parastagonospora nodorum SN15]|uniref:Uncharacterized protein n=1 Tax=Phaeosphaeria nodorum (strain SN15 / ATCC MYA-4574 / FGSC 10173) TaxID=321614 RepID=Q0UTW2_PHANO|nr:hypothetical protein SNOG_04802 [Parastagonospora nodorum SN15]EAT87193.2 hypothetical protein SNOG_04802 [Parastagonospora nodorum SN15]